MLGFAVRSLTHNPPPPLLFSKQASLEEVHRWRIFADKLAGGPGLLAAVTIAARGLVDVAGATYNARSDKSVKRAQLKSCAIAELVVAALQQTGHLPVLSEEVATVRRVFYCVHVRCYTLFFTFSCPHPPLSLLLLKQRTEIDFQAQPPRSLAEHLYAFAAFLKCFDFEKVGWSVLMVH